VVVVIVVAMATVVAMVNAATAPAMATELEVVSGLCPIRLMPM
jgi:hypothetical protein